MINKYDGLMTIIFYGLLFYYVLLYKIDRFGLICQQHGRSTCAGVYDDV